MALTTVIAAIGGYGLGVRRSWELTHGDFWFVVGRLLLTGLIASAASGVVSIVVNGGFLLGFAVFVAFLLLVQTLAFVATMIVTVCSHAVIIAQVDGALPSRG